MTTTGRIGLLRHRGQFIDMTAPGDKRGRLQRARAILVEGTSLDRLSPPVPPPGWPIRPTPAADPSRRPPPKKPCPIPPSPKNAP